MLRTAIAVMGSLLVLSTLLLARYTVVPAAPQEEVAAATASRIPAPSFSIVDALPTEASGSHIRLPVEPEVQPSDPVAHADGNEELVAYGNTLGRYLQDFESAHADSTDVMEIHARERTADSKEKLNALADAYQTLAENIIHINAPSIAASANAHLAGGYRSAGNNLSAIAQSADDAAFLKAIYAYNAHVDMIADALGEIIAIFATYNVTFSESDPGAMFTTSYQ